MTKDLSKTKRAIFPAKEQKTKAVAVVEFPFTKGDYIIDNYSRVYKIGKCTKKKCELLREGDDGKWEYYGELGWDEAGRREYLKLEKTLEEYKLEAIHHMQTGFKDLEQPKGSSTSTELVAVQDKTYAKTLRSGLMRQQQHVEIIKRTLEIMKSQMGVILNDLREKVRQVTRVVDVIELYLGVHENIVQIQEGDPASPDEPICFRQLVLHMDEETAEDIDFKDIDVFDQFMRDKTDQILPDKKGIVVCRPRATDKCYDPDDPMLNSFINDNNKQTYILIRNGDNLYRIWTSVMIYPSLFPSRDEMKKLLADTEKNYGFDKERAKDQMHQYKRNVLILQGLMDRTDILRPTPPGVTLFNPETYGSSIKFIYDGSDVLPSGRLEWDEFLKQVNDKTQRGDRVYLAKIPYGELSDYDMWRSPLHDKGWHRSKHGPPQPPPGVYNVSEVRDPITKGEKGNCFLISYKDSDERWDRQRGYVKRRNRTPFWLNQNDRFFVNYEHITLEDVEFYLNDRVNRRNYVRMMPVLRGIKKARLEELEWEKGFVQLVKAKVGSEPLIWEGIEWWKRKVIEKRPLKKEDAKAVRMVSKYVMSKREQQTVLEDKL